MTCALLILILGTAAAVGQVANPASPDRFPTPAGFTNFCGVFGDIPDTAGWECWSNFPSMPTPAQLQFEINKCGDYQYIQLPVGSATWSSGVSLHSNMKIIGTKLANGFPGTWITNVPSVNQGSLFGLSGGFNGAFAGNNNYASITGKMPQYTNVITVAATSLSGGALPFQPGRFIFIDSLNNTNMFAGGACWDTSGGYPRGLYFAPEDTTKGWPRWGMQMAMVLAVNGRNITIDPPLMYPDWDTNLQPVAWVDASRSVPAQNCGLEDIGLYQPKVSSNNVAIGMSNVQGVWMKNVFCIQWRYALYANEADQVTIRHCWFEGGSGVWDDYPLRSFFGSRWLVEDNVGVNLEHAFWVPNGCNGFILSYNFITNNATGTQNAWAYGSFVNHGVTCSMGLSEGNWLEQWQLGDNCWGGNRYMTSFRDRVTGWEDRFNSINYVNNIQAYSIMNRSRCFNVMGSVIGVTNHPTKYEWRPPNGSPTYADSGNNGFRLFNIGNLLTGDAIGTYDAGTYDSLYRAYNWVSAMPSGGKGVVSNGVANLPSSLYLQSKPDWFGDRTFPYVDPQRPDAAMNPANLPAGYRFIYRQDVPTGAGDTIAPSITITNPTTSGSYVTAVASIYLAGLVSDNVSVVAVNWNNVTTVSSGSASIVGGTWGASGIGLASGLNHIVVTAQDPSGNANSASINVTYNPASVPPTIVTQPQNVSVTQGNPATFSVAATGSGTLTYQWYGPSGIRSGATSSTLTIAACTTLDAGGYYCVVTGPGGNTTSSTATLTVHVPPYFTLNPVNTTNLVGATTVFTASASGDPTIWYQWYYVVQLQFGNYQWYPKGTWTTTPSLSIGPSDGASYAYFVVATNNYGAVGSSWGTLTLTNPPSPTYAPTITVQPASIQAIAGSTTNVHMVANGSVPLFYYWSGPIDLSGVNSSTVSLSPVTTAMAGTYSVLVSNFVGTVTSSSVNVSVVVPAYVAGSPPDVNAPIGGSASFTVTAGGTGPFTYQWYRVSPFGAIPGATSATYTISPVAANSGGQFFAVVQNAWGSANSSTATLTVPSIGNNNGVVLINVGLGGNVKIQSQ